MIRRRLFDRPFAKANRSVDSYSRTAGLFELLTGNTTGAPLIRKFREDFLGATRTELAYAACFAVSHRERQRLELRDQLRRSQAEARDQRYRAANLDLEIAALDREVAAQAAMINDLKTRGVS